MRLLAVALLAAMIPTVSADAAVNPRPFTIPAVREWKGGRGAFELPRKPRIVAPRRLNWMAHTLAGDLHGVVRRNGQADIALELGAVGHGREAYRLRIGRGVTVVANSSTGAFWGTRTLLQLARATRRMPRGDATDWPRYP